VVWKARKSRDVLRYRGQDASEQTSNLRMRKRRGP